jgi:hypothetical protein
MRTISNGDLCMELMRADTEVEVVAALSDAGYWSDETVWRYFDDNENNFSDIGNQQSEATAALIEKIVNSVDARLMNACWQAGIDPTSASAPASIRDAVARFFDPSPTANPDRAGRIAEWSPEKATGEARLITVAATGFMPSDGQPSITVADAGEGQQPDAFPETFLSLRRSNKLYIHFVQGKFNMGGTGALQFCSSGHRLQLIVSRRNPALVPNGSADRSREWGFTLVRRESPPAGGRSSVFTYLAPVGVHEGRDGGVLSFPANEWPIFPEADERTRDAYARGAEHGSLVKLYEYRWQGTKSNIVSSGQGLLRRIDAGLPELALPVRIFECRSGYRGHGGSFATNALGLAARLEQDRADNLEDGFPIAGVVTLRGRQVRARAFAFKPGKASNYRTPRQGVVFSVNGQSHATLPIDLFRRKAVGMSYLADSLFVLVDCSALESEVREDLFMNSRDRLRSNELSERLEQEIQSFLHDDPSLRALRNRRREEELSETLADSRPLVEVLQDIMRHSPALSQLFLQGLNMSAPFRHAGTGEGVSGNFQGKTYPTFFRFKGMADGETLVRDAHLDSRVRVAFETDASDDYFVRDLDPASLTLRYLGRSGIKETTDWSIRGPVGGSAHLALELPAGLARGDTANFLIEVFDPSRIDSFLLPLTLRIQTAATNASGGTGQTKVATTGRGRRGGDTRLALPKIIPVEEKDWARQSPAFDEDTALVVIHGGEDAETGAHVYDFFINVDNKHLRLTQKDSKEEPKVLRARFIYGHVLVGLALLQQARDTPVGDASDSDPRAAVDVEGLIRLVSSAIAGVLLPMMSALGMLAVEDY